MRKVLLLSYVFILGVILVSCGPPETYEKGMSYFQVQKYDSAMYYFDRLLPEDEEWLDSAKVMKGHCVEKIISAHDWALLSETFITYGKDTSWNNPARKFFKNELLNMIKKDSVDGFYKMFDAYKTKLPSVELADAMHYRMDSFLEGYVFNGTASLKGQKLYFERSESGVNAKSYKSLNGWDKNSTIYKDIQYDKEGVFIMQPRIYQGGGSYFGKGGSLRLVGKDSLKINYGKSLRGEVLFFIRDEKIETKPVAKK